MLQKDRILHKAPNQVITAPPSDRNPEEEGDSLNEDEDKEEEDIGHLQDRAISIASNVIADVFESSRLSGLEYITCGGYNHVWLVVYSTDRSQGGSQDNKFILRISREVASLQPYQIRHEVACLHFLKENVPQIPVPKVYAWDDGTSNSGPAFIAQEFIKGQKLSVVWPDLTEEQKTVISREIASVIVDLGETRFDCGIGGLAINAPAGPTIEAAKIFNGRTKFHSPDFYNIGPYTESKGYIQACYDREISFYTHAGEADLEPIAEAFEETSVSSFISQLQRERDAILEDDSVFQKIDAEPLVLVHEDFHSSNMLVLDGHLVGVLDWEFSGVYPLSELLGAAAILQISGPRRYENEEWTEQEEMKWQGHYLEEIQRVTRQRGWTEQDITTVMGGGHYILQKARSVMFP
ncbi:phosphotransferase family protein [Aspergillus glaucus CBS 516.65]|uniref:Aminoglycoside phosphotransferase domain-containing protein n=1 Tax=Aspergillus glaucus CBS 516.65 TaxID=1160497 RepID=A0A1L9VTY5_ASPGL|nr:hypothetical protein ASPGLDRAFT_43906 [Aspergillus glaucus CBS 516.65]OJJ87362.1 hypothetical protein ASPGLDRAFT_43906 [Aspergillus glaucus CBS 516.65]